MKKILIICFVLGNSVTLNAQYNLVPNPSFEIYDTCPNNGGQLYHSLYWTNPIIGISSPDYFNACGTPNLNVPSNQFGNEIAHSGVAYAGIITGHNHIGFPQQSNYREYAQTELSDSLVSGVDYCFRFYVSLADSMPYWSNNIGIYFSNNFIQDTCYACTLPYTPQFENSITHNLNNANGWTEIAGNYTAVGGERFITIGNFRDSVNTTLQNTGISSAFYYFPYYYLDDILITPCDSLTNLMEFNPAEQLNVNPNPSTGLFYIHVNRTINEAKIYNVFGEEVWNQAELKNNSTIDLTSKASGIYFLEIQSKREQLKIKLIKH